MVQKCNLCGKIASYFDANLGEWLCEECYKKNYNKVNLNENDTIEVIVPPS